MVFLMPSQMGVQYIRKGRALQGGWGFSQMDSPGGSGLFCTEEQVGIKTVERKRKDGHTRIM